MKSILNDAKKSKRKKKSKNSIPRFARENMISIEDEFPPDSEEQLLILEEIIEGSNNFFEVRKARTVLDHVKIDMNYGTKPKTLYWMKLNYEEED